MNNQVSNQLSKKSWFEKLLRFFRLEPKVSLAKIEEDSPKADDKDTRDLALSEDISNMHLLSEKVFSGMPKELREQGSATTRAFWRIGKEDGSIGQRQIERDYFKACAQDLSDQLYYFMQKESVPLKTKLEGSRDRKEKATTILKQAEDYRHDVNTREQLYPKQFSSTISWLYMIIGFLLILADIPLALMVTEKIFDFERSDTIHSIKDLLNIPVGDKCTNLFPHILKVLAGNWQLVIMTMGVALSSIYFKVFYDDFMAYPTDKAVRQFEDLAFKHRRNAPAASEDAAAVEEKNTQKELEKMLKKHNHKNIGKILILFFTLSTIFVLGMLRAEIEKGSGLNHVMYIMLTILFPVIGGILFSLGMGNFHNRRERRFSEKHFINKMEEHTKTIEEFTSCEMEVSTYTSFIKKCEDGFVQDNFEKMFQHSYLHGYQRGVVNPDKDLDMYDRAQRFRDRLLATKSNEALQIANKIYNSN